MKHNLNLANITYKKYDTVILYFCIIDLLFCLLESRGVREFGRHQTVNKSRLLPSMGSTCERAMKVERYIRGNGDFVSHLGEFCSEKTFGKD